MSSPQPPTYYRSRRDERRRRARRRGVIVVIVAVGSSPPSSWRSSVLGRASTCRGPARPGGSRLRLDRLQLDGALTIVGADDLWHSGPADLRFRDADGKPVVELTASTAGSGSRASAPTYEVPPTTATTACTRSRRQAAGRRETQASVKVGIDTTPPEVTAAKVAPDRTDGAGTVTLSFSAPAEDGVTVELGGGRRARTSRWASRASSPRPPASSASTWTIPSVDGEKLGPGTYFLSVWRAATGPATSRRSAPPSPASAR